MKMQPKPRYWSLFWYGSSRSICSEHLTKAAAVRAAKACERRGGAKHFFMRVYRVEAAK